MILKELRIRQGMTQKQLAKLMHVSSQTILNWESGIYEPKIKQLIALADIFHVSIDYLVERETKISCIEKIKNADNDDLIGFLKEYLTKVTKNK